MQKSAVIEYKDDGSRGEHAEGLRSSQLSFNA